MEPISSSNIRNTVGENYLTGLFLCFIRILYNQAMRDQVQEIKDKTDIVALIGEYVNLKPAGRHYKGLCPFHGERSPSFIVSPDIQIYKCFGCGESGDVFTFLEKHDGMEFSDALKHLAARTGVVLQTKVTPQNKERATLLEINSLAAQFYHYLLTKHALGKEGREYLIEKRGLTLETIDAFQLGAAPKSPNALFQFLTRKKKFDPHMTVLAGVCIQGKHGYVDRFRERAIFPIQNHHGETIALAGRILPQYDTGRVGKYINSPETPIYIKSNSLYGLSVTKGDIKRASHAIVVEGELDLLSSWQTGVKNVVAIKGSAFTEGQVQLLHRFVKAVTLALDSDFAGNNAALKGIFQAQEAGLVVKVVQMGEYKDPDEFARGAAEGYKMAIKNAVDVWDFVIDTTIDRYDITSGDGTAQVSRELVPLLANIPDAIVQEHYVTKLAGKLRIAPDTVMSQVRRFGTTQKVMPPISRQPSAQTRSRRIILEDRMIGLAFIQNPAFLGTPEIADLVRDVRNKKLVALLKENLSEEFDLKTFAQKVPAELSMHFSELVLKEEEEVDTHELASIAHEIMSLDIRESLTRLSQDISELEETENTEKLTAALSEHAQLAKKLAQITNSS